MNTLNISQLKDRARLSLAAHPRDSRFITLIYVGATVLAALLSVLLEFATTAMMEGHGGLDGMGKRAVLSTVSTFVNFAVTVSLPFWTYGYTYAAMSLSRQTQPGYDSLLKGFSRIGAILSAGIFQSILYTLVLVLCLNIASTAWLITPQGLELAQNAETIMTTTDPEVMLQYLKQMLPVYVIAGVLAIVPCLFLFYQMRLTAYGIMDGKRGIQAIVQSFHLMRRRALAFFKLDLSYWWYYVLQLVCAGLAWLDMGLTAIGIALPGDPQVWMLVSSLLAGAGQLVLAWYFQTEVAVTYATAYDEILQSGPAKPKPEKAPKNLPWDM